MEPHAVREKILTLLSFPSVRSVRMAMVPLLSETIAGYSLEESQWLWSAVLIVMDPSSAPDWVYERAEEFVQEAVRMEDGGAAAAFLECIKERDV
jgi:hypothetical protein